jgi:hypothetical protein
MCIVVDINALAPVFNEQCADHVDFRPVKEWIRKRKGYLVFGGSRFIRELSETYHYLHLVRLMKDSGQAVAIRKDRVDAAETELMTKEGTAGCNDLHIIALLGTSRCPLFCSKDSRSYKYIKDTSFYPDGMARVRIYSSKKNDTLLKPMSRNILLNQE